MVEAVADENANIIYGQIVDPEMQEEVRITVIATGFKANTAQSAMDFSRKDNVFNSTTPRNGAQQNRAPQQTQSTYQQLYSNEPRLPTRITSPIF